MQIGGHDEEEERSIKGKRKVGYYASRGCDVGGAGQSWSRGRQSKIGWSRRRRSKI